MAGGFSGFAFSKIVENKFSDGYPAAARGSSVLSSFWYWEGAAEISGHFAALAGGQAPELEVANALEVRTGLEIYDFL